MSPDRWPPMVAGRRLEPTDLLAQVLEACKQGVLELVDGGEDASGERVVGERPEPFGGLQFGTVGGQEDEMHADGDREIRRRMPAGLVEHEHDRLAGSRTNRLGECAEREAGRGRIDARQDEPVGLAGRRPDPAVEPGPLVAGVDRYARRTPLGAPDPAQDGLESDAMLILRPDFDARARMGALDLGYLLAQLLGKAAWAAGSAWAWAGRGRWGV